MLQSAFIRFILLSSVTALSIATTACGPPAPASASAAPTSSSPTAQAPPRQTASSWLSGVLAPFETAMPTSGAGLTHRISGIAGSVIGVPGTAQVVDVVTVDTVDGHPDLAPPPVVAPTIEAPSRSRRRMDLSQLDAAFKSSTGGITWDEAGKNQWEALAPTLGKPDFLTTTEEDLTPSPLFQKFMSDAARKVCADLFTRELSTPPARRVFFVDVGPDETSERAGARLDANLTKLLLRFHGSDVRGVEAQGHLDGWRWLYLTAEHLETPRAAWSAVCVALIEHPDFFTY